MLDFILNLLLKVARFGRPGPVLAEHLQTGINGEEAATKYFRKQGYHIIASRWSSPEQRGDLDIVAVKDDVICFIEVKTRTAHDSSPAERTVNAHKRSTLRKLARIYLRKNFNKRKPKSRFDILCVYLIPGSPAEFQHFKDAFKWNVFRKRDFD